MSLQTSYVTLNGLEKIRQDIRSLHIHSYEGDIYLAEITTTKNLTLMVIDESERPIIFRGKLRALKAFQGLDIKQTFLVHQSVSMEMIGLPQQFVEPMVIKMKNPDDSFLPV